MINDCVSVWNNCLRFIRENIGEQSYNTWFLPIVPLRLNKNILTIQVPSQFFYEWLEEHYVNLLRKAIDHEIGREGRLEYSIIVDKGNENNKPFTVNLPTSKPNTGKMQMAGGIVVKEFRNPFETREVNGYKYIPQLNQNYTFENFIEGNCNRLARAAGVAVANKPGTTSFNPLMLYSECGLGKTHLIQAIGNHILLNSQGKLVIYVTAENFTNQFIEAVKNNNIEDFRNYYLHIDVLLIDDIQQFAGKDRTQEIFFNIFNHLHQNNKQIIMTSDCPPRDLKGLTERLLSRFKWGLTADLQQPDFETRIAIIQRKMQADGIDLPHKVVEYLAYSVDTNIRELEGVLISLIAHSSLNRREIDLELAKQTLKNIVHNIETEVGIDFIQKSVADYFEISLDSLKAKTRKKEIVIARQIAMYFAKEYTNFSLKSIGYHFGGRDHSTVIHAVQSVNDLKGIDRNFRSTVEELEKKLKMKSI